MTASFLFPCDLCPKNSLPIAKLIIYYCFLLEAYVGAYVFRPIICSVFFLGGGRGSCDTWLGDL